MKIKRYLIEMANDIMDKIMKDEKYVPELHVKYPQKISRAIVYAQTGFLTNIETIGEIMAAYDDFVYDAYTN